MTAEPSLPGRPEDIQSAVVKALVQAHMPQDVEAPPRPSDLLGVDIEQQVALPPLLERGLSQGGISTTELWVKTLALEVTIRYLERDIARLADQIQAVDDKRWSEGRIIAVLAVIIALTAGIAKLVG